jgi:hypothetical protein
MEFFSLPKTNLHKEFREKFCNMEKQVVAKYLE